MPAKRSLRLDLFALTLLALAAFLGTALLTYDAADPPGRLVYPNTEAIQNACGRAGALTAHFLLAGLGLGSYYLVLSVAVLGCCLLGWRGVTQPSTRLAGWLISLMAVTTLIAMLMPSASPGPVIGAGGYLGAMGQGLLEANFAATGAYILLAALLAAGLLLCTDYLLFGLTAQAAKMPLRVAGNGLAQAHSAYRQKRQPAEDEAEAEDEEEDELEDEQYEEEDEDDAEYEEDEEYDEEEEEDEQPLPVKIAGKSEADEEAEAPAKPSAVGGRIAAALGIKKRRKNDERQQVIEEIEAASQSNEITDYELPSLDLLVQGEPFSYEQQERDVRRKAKILEKTFASFGFTVRVVEIETGPVIAQFEVELEAGLRLSKITGLADDLAIALRVPSVRIVAPIPGKNTVGIEVPNKERQLVRMREVIDEAQAEVERMRIPIFLGKDVSGNPLVCDLTALPHLLIAGRTGTGKSVCLNSIIMSMLMTRGPDDVRMLLIDPKMVELSCYMKLPHLMHPVVTDMKKAEAILAWAVDKMEERYQLLARAGVRHVSVYNQLGEEELFSRLAIEDEEERKQIPTHLPYIVIVADEMADLMMTAAKEVEAHIIRLAQKSRAVGIHLVLATQKPTVDVITGLIKSNLPARISFQVASRTDSRVVLDEMGADKLLGNGDMLFLWPGTSMLLRGQGSFVSDDEIMRVVDDVGTTDQQFVHELIHLPTESETPQAEPLKNRDELYEAAVDVIVREGRGSVSLLQRTLGIGYGRAARLIDYMAEDGIVGEYNGSQAREVQITFEQWEAMRSSDAAPAAGPAVAPSIPVRNTQTPTVPKPAGKSTSGPTPKQRRTVALRQPRNPVDEVDDELDATSPAVNAHHAAQSTALLAPWEADEEEADTLDAEWQPLDEVEQDELTEEEDELVDEEAEEEYEDADAEDELEDEWDEAEDDSDADDEYDEDEYEEAEYEEDEYEDDAEAEYENDSEDVLEEETAELEEQDELEDEEGEEHDYEEDVDDEADEYEYEEDEDEEYAEQA